MKILYRDFARKTSEGFLGMDSTEIPLAEAVANANKWISERQIKVLNVETLIASDRFTSTSDVDGFGVRIWYTE